MLITGSAHAQIFWLNMVVDGQPMSLPVTSTEQCNAALDEYVRSGLINFVSCDVEPLPTTVSMN